MRRLTILFFFLSSILLSQSLVISGEKRFVAYLKKLEKNQNQVKFIIQDKNSSLDAFNDIKLAKATVAIVRGDILADNMGVKNFFTNRAFQDFKVVSKLDDSFSTYLYLVSKDGMTDAYTLLNPDPKRKEMKKISVGYLKDLSNIYLLDIAKSVNSNYRFRYKFYSAEESFAKLEEESIDAGYLFLSKKMADKARSEGFKLTNISKPVNIKEENFAKKIKEQKAFHKMANGIRVDNYLIASSSISDFDLTVLTFALKNSGSLVNNVKAEYGEVDNRIPKIAAKIDMQQAQAKAEEEVHAKECEEAKEKGLELATPKASLKIYTKDAVKKIKSVLRSIKVSEELGYFKPQLDHLLLSVKETNKEGMVLVKSVLKQVSECNTGQVASHLVALNSKVDEIQSSRKELAMIQSQILQKGQQDKEMLLREEREMLLQEERRIESEAKALEFELAREQRAEIKALSAPAVESVEVKKETDDGFLSIFTGLFK